MKTFLYFMLLGLFTGYSATTFCLIDQVKIELVKDESLCKERELFLHYWLPNYQSHTLNQVPFGSLVNILNDDFDIEEKDYQEHASNQFFCRAIIDDRLVGYVSFDIGVDKSAYVRQWAFLPDLNNVDGISELLFAIFDYVPDVSYIYLAVKYGQKDFVKMISEVGFEKIDLQVETHNHLHYDFYAIACYDKCGTCYCACDEEDLVYEMMCGCDLEESDAEKMGLMAPLSCGCSAGKEEKVAE